MKIKIISIILMVLATSCWSQTITKPFTFKGKAMEMIITSGENWTEPTEKSDGVSYVAWAEGASGFYSEMLFMSDKIAAKPEKQPTAFPFWSYKKTKIAVDVNSGATYQTSVPQPQDVAYYLYIEVSQPSKEDDTKTTSIIYMCTYSMNEEIKELEMRLLGYGNAGYVDTNIEDVEAVSKIIGKIILKLK